MKQITHRTGDSRTGVCERVSPHGHPCRRRSQPQINWLHGTFILGGIIPSADEKCKVGEASSDILKEGLLDPWRVFSNSSARKN